MGTAFTADTLRRGIEGDSADALLALYADDARVRVVDHVSPPSSPRVLRGRDEIGALLADVYSRDMTHTLEGCVVDGDRAAFSESCRYADGTRVLSESMITLEDGRIREQIMIQAWDE